MTPRTLVFLLTEDWFFASHFLQRGLAAKAAGWRVILVAHESDATLKLRAAGIEVIPVPFIRRRLNPFAELAFTWRLARLYRRLQPDLVHHIALKPIVIGGLAARLAGVPAIVNAPVGLGFVFSSDKLLAKLLKPVVSLGLRLTLSPRRARVVFENPDDLAALANAGMVRPAQTALIRGAGVDITAFHPTPEPPPPLRVILIARMIREKGVADFVAAARLLQGQAEFVLVGAPDPGNPNTVTEAELRNWQAQKPHHLARPAPGHRRPAALRPHRLPTLHLPRGPAEIRAGSPGRRQTPHRHRHPRLPRSGDRRRHRLAGAAPRPAGPRRRHRPAAGGPSLARPHGCRRPRPRRGKLFRRHHLRPDAFGV